MRNLHSRTSLHTALGGIALSLILAVGFTAQTKAQTPPSGALPLGRGGQQKDGTGWVVNPFDIEDEGILAAGREILCNPWPGEETEGGSSAGSTPGLQPQDCLLYQDQRIQPEARVWYQRNLPFLFYQVPGSPQSSALGGSARGSARLAREQQGQVLQATTGSASGGQQDDWLSIVWGEGTGENKGGAFGALARLSGAYNAAAASNVTNFARIAEWGDSFLPVTSKTAGILVPGSEIGNALTAIGYIGRALLDALAQRPAAQDAYAGNPNENIGESRTRAAQDPGAQAPVCGPGQLCGAEGNQFFAASRLGENVGGVWATPFNGLLGQGAFGNIFSGMFGNILGNAQGLISQFGNPDLASLFNRFPLQALTGMTNRFGANRLQGLFNQNFGSGSGGGGGARLDRPPQTQILPRDTACPSPALTPSAVADIADILGMPRGSEPWTIQFQRLDVLGNVSGTNPETSQQVVVGPASLPGEVCAWTVRAGNELAIVSDQPDGGQIRLIP